MSKLLILIIGVYLIVCPFYFFDSGIPQPSHYMVSIAFLAMFFSRGFSLILKEKVVHYLLLFLLLIIVINSVYYFKYYGDGNTFLLTSAYYVFNFLFFLLFLKTLKQGSSQNIDKIVLFLLISLGVQVILAILDINKITQYIVTGRSVIYFNNPNQLGYFALLTLTLFTVLPSRYRKNRLIVMGAIAGSVILAVVSSSRIVLLGLVVLALLSLHQLDIKLNFKYWILISVFGIVIALFLSKTEFIQKRISLVEVRNNRQDTTGVSEAQIRGYDRIWLHPKNLVFGAGEGKYDRFKSQQKGELHSGLGTILFSYGIIGITLFLLFFYKIIAGNIFYNFLLLTPILLYNLVHQGFRNPLFWGVLATVYVTSLQLDEFTKIKS